MLVRGGHLISFILSMFMDLYLFFVFNRQLHIKVMWSVCNLISVDFTFHNLSLFLLISFSIMFFTSLLLMFDGIYLPTPPTTPQLGVRYLDGASFRFEAYHSLFWHREGRHSPASSHFCISMRKEWSSTSQTIRTSRMPGNMLSLHSGGDTRIHSGTATHGL